MWLEVCCGTYLIAGLLWGADAVLWKLYHPERRWFPEVDC